MLGFLFCLVSLLGLATGAYQEGPCSALGGKCQSSWNSCPGSYASGKCPTQSWSIKKLRVHAKVPVDGVSSQPAPVEASSNPDSVPLSPVMSNAASHLARPAAHRRVYLLPRQVSGANDGADAKSNIIDTCSGQKAKLSSYGNAPGGYTCLDEKMLRVLKAVLDSTPSTVQINCIAGGSHSKSSTHYKGRAFDMQAGGKAESLWKGWVSTCSRNGMTLFQPGDPGHSRHVHCNS